VGHFLVDQNLPVDVAHGLRRRRHRVWTASEAGLSDAGDDDLTAWAADHGAVLVTADSEFSQRRGRNAIGAHVWMRCPLWDAAALLEGRLGEVLEVVEHRSDVLIVITKSTMKVRGVWD
jgi:Domain of unknown function (DUF5615)